ncbi:hypothetical protein Q670_06255 [Alcanivorax sp. P2S70]|jgi:CHASE2 domain-containing sensor protein|uniref:CHASE2 domain-containing protein n=1 Tax=Alcanivorax profundi TaxID=2338368 RepID=A0A418XTF9_9GAMM|nr:MULTISPECIES: CHASE2 domain-containing protein [Alcanivorax]ERP85856.1 hypothetical protein Q670_06255 [Alcanivorax sp. P2S70]RJG15947.1 CHASE2 domain-containing protein [Alcanivorax profundi]
MTKSGPSAVAALYHWVHGKWTLLPARWRPFVVNLLVGMAIVVWIHLNPDSSMVKRQQDRGLDWLSRMVTNTPYAPQPDQPVVMVDVDSATYAQWGEPWLTPADRIARIIALLLDAEPAQILVDFDLSRRTDLAPLADILSRHQGGKAAKTQLIFMKTQASLLPANSRLPAFRDSALDELVASNDNLHWAAPLYRPDPDGVIRHWQLVIGGCENDRLVLLPSVQLLSVMLSDGVDKSLEALLAPDQQGCLAMPHFSGRIVLGSGKQIDLAGEQLQHRIVFALPPNPESGYFPVDWQGRAVPALTILSARDVLAAKRFSTGGLLTGAIVIIGASHRDSGDIHLTPVGQMPGSLVLANSITALQGLDQVQRPPFVLILLVDLLLILGVSWLFVVMSPFAATLVSSAVIALLVVPFSLLAFSQGVWLDFALPILAVQMRSVFAKATFSYHKVRRKGIKGVLK